MATSSATAAARARRASDASTQGADNNAADALPERAGPDDATDPAPADAAIVGDADLTEVRVLLAYDHHLPNDLATVPADTLRGAIAAGYVDPDPAAIAYAKSLTA